MLVGADVAYRRQSPFDTDSSGETHRQRSQGSGDPAFTPLHQGVTLCILPQHLGGDDKSRSSLHLIVLGQERRIDASEKFVEGGGREGRG
jgi:hypothetical protein